MTERHAHDHGLLHDLHAIAQGLTRRRMLGFLAGAAALAPLAGCGSDGSDGVVGGNDAGTDGSTDAGTDTGTATDASAVTDTGTTADSGVTSCSTIPQETGGPYPGDGTNGVNALAMSGIVRSDIRASFGSSTTVAQGVPLTIILTLVSARNSCAPLANHAVYLWHCNRDGNYSLYSSGITSENYLRGVQQSDASGVVTFQSIFPGAYSGRWPHIHFEIFASLAAATSGTAALRTSQLALPQSACDVAYATTGYSASVRNLASSNLATDNVFSDGVTLQLATVTGNVTDGFVARLVVAIDA